MTTRILKQFIKFPTHGEPVEIKNCGEILHAHEQHGAPCVWFFEQPGTTRKVRIVGTGHDFDDATLEYVGTVHSGGYVWHVMVEEAG